MERAIAQPSEPFCKSNLPGRDVASLGETSSMTCTDQTVHSYDTHSLQISALHVSHVMSAGPHLHVENDWKYWRRNDWWSLLCGKNNTDICAELLNKPEVSLMLKKMLWVSRSHHLRIPNIILPANSRLVFTVWLHVNYAFCSLEGRWRCTGVRLDVLLLFVCFILQGSSKEDGYKL